MPSKRHVPFLRIEGPEAFLAAFQGNNGSERQAVVQRFSRIIRGQNRNVVNVECYGSSSTGLFVKESDVDLVILVPANQLQDGHLAFLTKIHNQLMAGQRVWRLDKVRIIISPAVPLVRVKAIDMESGLEVDITCGEAGSRTSHLGLQNSQWIRETIAEYPDVKYLVVILKMHLQFNKLPNIGAGGISSYVLTLMVISYVQHNPGGGLMGFLKLYGYDFDYENKAIVLTNGGRIVDKRQLRGMTDPLDHKLIIQDPVDPTKNAAKLSLGGLGRVRGLFQGIYYILKQPVTVTVGKNTSREGYYSSLVVPGIVVCIIAVLIVIFSPEQ